MYVAFSPCIHVLLHAAVLLYIHSENKSAMLYNFVIAILPSEGFSVGSQSSVAGYNQLPFPPASQTHLTSRIQGWWESLNNQNRDIT